MIETLRVAAVDYQRRLFFRRGRLRRSAQAVSPTYRRRASDVSHLPFYETGWIGPLQRDEAMALYGLVRVLAPRTLVEIGFGKGFSAFNLLLAMPSGARLYSFDNGSEAQRVARRCFPSDPRFSFQVKSQEQITPDDLGGEPVDFVFLDASHRLDLNVATFAAIKTFIADDAVIAVHDTGTWARSGFGPQHFEAATGHDDLWLSQGEYQHQIEERQFINWLRANEPEFAQLNLHTTKVLRNGITLLQRSQPLPTGPHAPSGTPAAAGRARG